MASRIMHLTIGSLIRTELDYDTRFLLGNLLPDAHEHNLEDKYVSHFKIYGDNYKIKRFFDYNKFAMKYREVLCDEVYLGYYCHLISDDIWLTDIFSKYIPRKNEIGRKECLEKYYRDFCRLNYILIQKYSLKNELDYIDTYSLENIEEINHNLISVILKELKVDFAGRTINCLELLDIKDIINYIDKCMKVSINNLNKLKMLTLNTC